VQLLCVRAKDAVCDAIRDRRGSKPLPPEPGRTADLPLYVTAYLDRLTIYRDMSGASLHRWVVGRQGWPAGATGAGQQAAAARSLARIV
jgi:23S rRNA G2445 N2-methylase RlmL